MTHQPVTCLANLHVSGEQSRACRTHHRIQKNLPEPDLDEPSAARHTSMRAGVCARPSHLATPWA
jgi:hypothetical protein